MARANGGVVRANDEQWCGGVARANGGVRGRKGERRSELCKKEIMSLLSSHMLLTSDCQSCLQFLFTLCTRIVIRHMLM